PVAVMGVINVSPESFHAGSVYHGDEAVLKAALGMVEAGAALIDVGARSSAPYLKTGISEGEETERLVRAVGMLAAKLPGPGSAGRSASASRASPSWAPSPDARIRPRGCPAPWRRRRQRCSAAPRSSAPTTSPRRWTRSVSPSACGGRCRDAGALRLARRARHPARRARDLPDLHALPRHPRDADARGRRRAR